MTWEDIQIESLKKMFLNKEVLEKGELDSYKEDKKYKTYLSAMPQAYNEAVNLIIENNPLVKTYRLEKTNNKALYDLNNLIDDFKCIYNIDCSSDNVYFSQKTKNILEVSNWNNEEIIVYYEAYPTLFDEYTYDTFKIELERKYAEIIPLYIAGELYKDDDLSLSTIYMNEFISNLNSLSNKNHTTNNKIQTIYRMEW